MDLNMVLAVFTILSGIVAVFDLIKYAIALAKWVNNMIHNAKK